MCSRIAAPADTASVGPVAHLLGAEAVRLEYPTQVVFDSVTLGVNDGARIGIVGRNGDGKSSLLGVLTGEVLPDSGRVTRRSGLRVSALSQADTLVPDRSVGATLVGDRAEHQWAGDARVRDVVGWSPTSTGTQRSPRSAAGSDDGCSSPSCWWANGT
jgi:ABC transport system ATP-binding/permease protein